MNLRSNFFNALEEKKCWWVIKSLESQNSDVKNQLEGFDNIAHAIEMSSPDNKKILGIKRQQVMNYITPGRSNFIFPRSPQALSLSELIQIQPEAKVILEKAYAENVFRASVLYEIRAFDELIKAGLQEIQFLEEVTGRKMPDFKAKHNGQNVYVEVKTINPEKAEEQRMMFGLAEFVELDSNWWEKVRKKIMDALGDAKAKFEAINAYTQECKRYVYVSIIWWSSNATWQHQAPEKLITEQFIHGLETDFDIELKFFKTF